MKKKLTTLLTLALVAVFALALVACDDKHKPTSEKGNTYKQSDFVVEWESDEVKNAVLNDSGLTEDQFKQFYNKLDMTMIFIDGDQVLVNAPGYIDEEGSGFSSGSLFYSIAENGLITFYKDKDKKSPLTDGIFMHEFVISSDYTTIGMSSRFSDTGKTKCEIVLTIV